MAGKRKSSGRTSTAKRGRGSSAARAAVSSPFNPVLSEETTFRGRGRPRTTGQSRELSVITCDRRADEARSSSSEQDQEPNESTTSQSRFFASNHIPPMQSTTPQSSVSSVAILPVQNNVSLVPGGPLSLTPELLQQCIRYFSTQLPSAASLPTTPSANDVSPLLSTNVLDHEVRNATDNGQRIDDQLETNDAAVDSDTEIEREDSTTPSIENANEQIQSTSNANRLVRKRDIRFNQVKGRANQGDTTARVYRNQLSSYSVLSAKMKYNLNVNVEIKLFPNVRMLSPGEESRKDSSGNKIEAFELPNFNHITGMKIHGKVVSKFVPGKKSDPEIKKIVQSLYSSLFPYTGYYPCSAFLNSFTTILVERYSGLHDEQSPAEML